MNNEDNLTPLEKYLPQAEYIHDALKEILTEDKEFYVFCNSQVVSTHISQLNISYFNILISYCLPEKPFSICTDEEKKLFIQKDENDLDYFDRLKKIYLNKFGPIYEVDYLNQYIKLNFSELQKVLIKMNLKEIPASAKNIFYFEDNFFNPPSRFYGTNESVIGLNQIFFSKITSEPVDYFCNINNQIWIVSKNFNYIITPDSIKINLTGAKKLILQTSFSLYHENLNHIFQSNEVMNQDEIPTSYKYLSNYLAKNQDISVFFDKISDDGHYRLTFPIIKSYINL